MSENYKNDYEAYVECKIIEKYGIDYDNNPLYLFNYFDNFRFPCKPAKMRRNNYD